MTATASGLQVPPFPDINLAQTVEAHTTDETFVLADVNAKVATNTGQTATVEHALPSAVSVAAGCGFRFAITAAQIVRLQPASGEAINYNGSAVANKYLQIAGVIGNYADLYSNGVGWICQHANGVLTKEA